MTYQKLTPVMLAAAMLLAACGGSDDNGPSPVVPPENAPKKNVVFFLGDGMGITTLTAARIYSKGEDGALTIDELPETAFIHTYSRDGQVTDSAPSMAAYMTGVKMNNEVISMSAETSAVDAQGKAYAVNEDSTCPAGNGEPVPTLLELMKQAGYGTGIVTTTRVTHATPATTYAHVCHRDAYNTIAAALVPGGEGYNARLGDGLDVIIGGGIRNFLPAGTQGSRRNDERNLVAELQAANYHFAANRAQFDALPTDGSKIAALLTPSDMSYEFDRDPAKEPSIAEMTEKAIDALAAQNRGFFLMVEGGRIDHALHATNARRALDDTVAFDQAIATAIEKLEAIDPGLQNTLIVVTADHDHTLQMNGYAARTGPTTPTNPGVLGLVNNYVNGQPSTDVDGNSYTILGFGNGPNRPATRSPLTEAQVADPDYLQEAVVPLAVETHGGGDVFLGAKGMGAERFKGTMVNTEVFDLIKEAVGL
ncbi:alkaline phosphatase [Lampropedia cohaerens]|uniref:Alkaline phosphatase n=1 Tax=Lampropedia cohaerens TaxID=1610491 RepID=A0A0U1Q0I1_9BURK|nr:alkaline phosphatase [Lampropedia cohaerens]KKW68246.1 alkaline phosphatase [Lampropedia cohaerens]